MVCIVCVSGVALCGVHCLCVGSSHIHCVDYFAPLSVCRE